MKCGVFFLRKMHSIMVDFGNELVVYFFSSCKNKKKQANILLHKDWAVKKVTIFNSVVYLVKTSENILFVYLQYT
jgi:hypothetical protein